jgi:hypothetical protein
MTCVMSMTFLSASASCAVRVIICKVTVNHIFICSIRCYDSVSLYVCIIIASKAYFSMYESKVV